MRVMFHDYEYSEMTFSDMLCTGTDISGKEFYECVFKNCLFENAVFTNSIFENCEFDLCSLILPDFKNTTIDDVVFKECKITGLNFGEINDFSMSFTFKKSKLLSCSFVGLDLKNTTFTNSMIVDSVFRECNLHKSDFEGVAFKSTSFSVNDLSSSNFRDASGFFINPCDNRLKGATFSTAAALELLKQFEIEYV